MNMGGGRNFERPDVERPILRNLKNANVKSCERSSFSIFLFTNLFFYSFLYLNTQIFDFFFNFNTQVFKNLLNLVTFHFVNM